MTGVSPFALTCARAFEAALQYSIGVLVQTNDVARARTILFRFRKELGDPDFQKIQVRISPINPSTELWLVKTGAPDAENN